MGADLFESYVRFFYLRVDLSVILSGAHCDFALLAKMTLGRLHYCCHYAGEWRCRNGLAATVDQ